MTRAELRALARSYLATTPDDPAYPDPVLDLHLNGVVDALVADYPEGLLIAQVTLTPRTADGRWYALAEQSPPVTDFARADDVRMVDANGYQLREVPFSQRTAWRGLGYSIVGVDADTALVLTPDTAPSGTLALTYGYWPAPAPDSGPAIVPVRFHDLLALEVARLCFAAGNESAWPGVYEERRLDRRAQLFDFLGRRSQDVMLRRTTDS